jgi:PIN domain nuclease of toxin-antitoxin system
MIVLDTHIWIWWVHGDERISKSQVDAIQTNEGDVIGISAISCWEVAKLVERGRLELPCSVREWFEQALAMVRLQGQPAGRLSAHQLCVKA